MLLKHGRGQVPLPLKESIRKVIAKCGGLTLGAVLDGIIDSVNIRVVCRLLLEGFLHCDLNQPLLPSTTLRLATGVDKSVWVGDRS